MIDGLLDVPEKRSGFFQLDPPFLHEHGHGETYPIHGLGQADHRVPQIRADPQGPHPARPGISQRAFVNGSVGLPFLERKSVYVHGQPVQGAVAYGFDSVGQH